MLQEICIVHNVMSGGTMYPKCILFDLDDTIISFEGAAEVAWKRCCSSFVNSNKVNFNDEELLNKINEIRKWYWNDPIRHKRGRMNMLAARREIVLMAMEQLEYSDEISSISMADSYTIMQDEMLELFPNALVTLETLKNLDVKLGLVTNGSSEKQREKLNRFKLNDYFDYFFIEGEIGVGKPDIKVYEIALDKINLSSTDVWMVGDNLIWDVQAPQKLGIYSIWNDFRSTGLPKDSLVIPDRTINNIYELIDRR